MKQLIFTVIFIFSAFIFSVSAQSTLTKQNFESGVKLANKGKFETALPHFQTSLEGAQSEPENKNFLAKIHFNIGVCLYQLKNQAKAVVEFERAIGFNPKYEKAFYALGMAQFELKNTDESERAFLNALHLNKQNGETWFDLAFVYLFKRDYSSAKGAFENSIEFETVSAAIGRNNLGVIFALGGDFASAIKQFEQAIYESNGQLKVSKRNLQFCKTYQQNSGKDLIAKLEFGKN